MADIFTKKKRSDIMSRIRSSGTKPEHALYHIVRTVLGHRWRIDRNVNTLPGRPDVVVPTLSLVIQAHGCFYHYCPSHGHFPKTNRAYWVPKIRRNIARDASATRQLRSRGYTVWNIWEHALKGKGLEVTYKKIDKRILKLRKCIGD